MKHLPVSINACLVPTEGPQREDCARFGEAFDRHVKAHLKGNDAPCSCPESCRWFEERRAA